MKTKLLGLMSFILLLMGCSVVRYHPIVMDAVAPDPNNYSTMDTLSAKIDIEDDANCSVMDFLESKGKDYDAVIGLRVEEIVKTRELFTLVFNTDISCSYKAIGVKYKTRDGSDSVKVEAPRDSVSN